MASSLVKLFKQKKFSFLAPLNWNTIRKGNITSSCDKKVHAFLVGYHGMGYSGLQIHNGKLTIEGEILGAFLKVGLITQREFENARLMKLNRTSRTDAGVSAAKQLLAMEIAIDKSSIPSLTESINDCLPSHIRIFGIKKVLDDFNCWKECTGRIYEYLLPTFAFAPLEELTLESFRISDKTITKLNEVLELFKGSHRFHNFTRDKSKKENSAVRNIRNISCSKPFIRNDIEFITICINGQSFLIHQIRKMIGLAIVFMRGMLPDGIIERAFEEEFLILPKAPPLGLILDDMTFDIYHIRLGRRRFREALIWDDNVKVISKRTPVS